MRLDEHLLTLFPDYTLKELQGLIMTGQVLVDDFPVQKPGASVKASSSFRLKSEKKKYVSRGGLKLESAFETFQVSAKNKHCLDIGVSTGGFSDYLLQNSAQTVVGVDVSYGLTDYQIRNHPNMVLIERCNAKELSHEIIKNSLNKRHLQVMIAKQLSLIVMDVSFISILALLPTLKSLVVPGSDIVTLVKPQFEVPKEKVGPGGIVTDEIVIEDTLAHLKSALSVHFDFKGECQAGIKGTKGNQDTFFI